MHNFCIDNWATLSSVRLFSACQSFIGLAPWTGVSSLGSTSGHIMFSNIPFVTIVMKSKDWRQYAVYSFFSHFLNLYESIVPKVGQGLHAFKVPISSLSPNLAQLLPMRMHINNDIFQKHICYWQVNREMHSNSLLHLNIYCNHSRLNVS